MEQEDFLPDDLLRDLFRNQPMETPGEDFTLRVMEKILPSPEILKERKPIYQMITSSWPYVVVFIITVIFLMTSDLPFTNYIPGKGYFTKNLLPSFSSLFSGLKPFVSNSKNIPIPLMVILAGSILVGFDHFLFRKLSIRHQTTN